MSLARLRSYVLFSSRWKKTLELRRPEVLRSFPREAKDDVPMPRNKRDNRYTRLYIPIEYLEYVTKQNLNGIAIRDAQKVKDACAKWEDYLKLQK
jgi:hypothetical protein